MVVARRRTSRKRTTHLLAALYLKTWQLQLLSIFRNASVGHHCVALPKVSGVRMTFVCKRAWKTCRKLRINRAEKYVHIRVSEKQDKVECRKRRKLASSARVQITSYGAAFVEKCTTFFANLIIGLLKLFLKEKRTLFVKEYRIWMPLCVSSLRIIYGIITKKFQAIIKKQTIVC